MKNLIIFKFKRSYRGIWTFGLRSLIDAGNFDARLIYNLTISEINIKASGSMIWMVTSDIMDNDKCNIEKNPTGQYLHLLDDQISLWNNVQKNADDKIMKFEIEFFKQ